MRSALGPRSPQSLGQLFWVFTKMTMQGFGGVYAVAQNTLVEREQWLSKLQFVELLSLSQILPGPNVVNLSLVIGDRFFGWRGAAVALLGLLLVPLIIVLSLAASFAGLSHLPAATGALRGMGAVASGLVLGTALKLLPALSGNPNGPWACALLTLASIAAMAIFRWPLAYAVLGIGSLAFALAWWRLSRADQAKRST